VGSIRTFAGPQVRRRESSGPASDLGGFAAFEDFGFGAADAVAGDVEEVGADGVGEAFVVAGDAVAEAFEEGVGGEAEGDEHVAGGDGGVEVAAELVGEAIVQACEQQASGVVAVVLAQDGGFATFFAFDDLDFELGGVAIEVFASDFFDGVDVDLPADELLGGDADGHVGKIGDEDDDGVVDERDVGDLFAREVLEDGFGLDARHDAGLGEVEAHGAQLDGFACEELFEVVLDDFGAA